MHSESCTTPVEGSGDQNDNQEDEDDQMDEDNQEDENEEDQRDAENQKEQDNEEDEDKHDDNDQKDEDKQGNDVVEHVKRKQKKRVQKTSTTKRRRVVVESDDEVASEEGVDVESEEDKAKAQAVVFESAVATLTDFTANSSLIIGMESLSVSLENSVVLTFRDLILELLHENQMLQQKEFTVSVHLLLAFVRYKQRFTTFFLMCESLPELFAEEEMDGVETDAARRKNLIKSAEIYLTKLASNLLSFFKKFQKIQDGTDSIVILDEVFPTISSDQKVTYQNILNDPDVRKMIKYVSVADEIFMQLNEANDFKTCRCFLVNRIVDRFCSKDGLGNIRTPENEEYILSVLKNVSDYQRMGLQIEKKRLNKILTLLESCELDFRKNTSTVSARLRSTTIFDQPDYTHHMGSVSSSSRSRSSSSSRSRSKNRLPVLSSSSSSSLVIPVARPIPEVTSTPTAQLSIPVRASVTLSSSSVPLLSSPSSSTLVSVAHLFPEATSTSVSPELSESAFLNKSPVAQVEVMSTRQTRSASSLTRSPSSSASSASSASSSSSSSSSSAASAMDPTNRRKRVEMLAITMDCLLYESQKWGISLEEIARSTRNASLDLTLGAVKYWNERGPKQVLDRWKNEEEPVSDAQSTADEVAVSVAQLSASSTTEVAATSEEKNKMDCGDERSTADEEPVSDAQNSAPITTERAATSEEKNQMDCGDERSTADEEAVSDAQNSAPITTEGAATSEEKNKMDCGDERSTADEEPVSDAQNSAPITTERAATSEEKNQMDCGDERSTADEEAVSDAQNSAPITTEGAATSEEAVSDAQLLSASSSTTEKAKTDEPIGSAPPISETITTAPDIFSVSDYRLVDSIADKLFSDFVTYESKEKYTMEASVGRQYESIVLSLYVQVLRTHFMTRKFKNTLQAYKDLNADKTYKKHKDLFLMFESTTMHIDAVKAEYGISATKCFSGERTLENAMKFLFPRQDFNPTFIKFELPRKLSASEAKDDLTSLASINQAFSDFLQTQQDRINETFSVFLQNKQVLQSSEFSTSSSSPSSSSSSSSTSCPKVDLSVLFVDFCDHDTKRKCNTSMDFPNRIVVTLKNNTVLAYQTVGAVYKAANKLAHDSYAVRVLSRNRLGGEHVLHHYFLNTSTMEKSERAKGLSYIIDNYVDQSGQRQIIVDEKKPLSLFPSEFAPENSNSKQKYFIQGVVLALNHGQIEGLSQGYAFPKVQNSLSLLDPAVRSGSQTIHAREIRMLADRSRDWLSDEILGPASKKFLGIGKELDIFSSLFAEEDKPKVVLIEPPHVLHTAVLKHLVPDTVNARVAKKSNLHRMEYTETALQDGYLASKELWEYRNIYSLPDSWFFSHINYPDNQHWMFIGILAAEAKFFIYDPVGDKGYKDSVSAALDVYIDLEGTDFLSTTSGAEVPCSQAWKEVPCYAQLQPDKFNCGMMTLIAFFRAVTKLAQNAPSEVIYESWICSTSKHALEAYREELMHLLTDVFVVDDEEPKDRRGGNKKNMERPAEGKRYAGFRYFQNSILGFMKKPSKISKNRLDDESADLLY